MGELILVVRLVLAVVFAVAGLGKLLDRVGSRQALRDFGLPATLASPLATVLPLAELAVALALIPASTAWWGALGALALLLSFLFGIAFNLRRGRTPACHCFGRLHSTPAGMSTLVRNALFAVLAGLLVWAAGADPGPDATSWIGSLSRVDLIELVLGLVMLGILLAGGSLFLQVMAQNGRLSLRIEALESRLGSAATGSTAGPAAGLAVGAPAPPFTLDNLDGETVSLDELRAAGKPVILVFSDPDCGPCGALLPDLVTWQREHAAEVTLAMVSRGAAEANRAKRAGHGLRHVLLQRDHEVAEAYQAHATPTALVIRADGTVGSPLAPGAAAIAALVVRTARPPAVAAAINGLHNSRRTG